MLHEKHIQSIKIFYQFLIEIPRIIALMSSYFLVVFLIKKQPLSSFECDILYKDGKPVRVCESHDTRRLQSMLLTVKTVD